MAETLAFTFRGLLSQSFYDLTNQIWCLILVPRTPAITTGLRKHAFSLIDRQNQEPCLVQSIQTKSLFH